MKSNTSDHLGNEKKMLTLIQEAHAHQSRNNGKTPYWEHCYSVASILDDAIETSGEFIDSADLVADMRIAALGHDLYEDTQVTPQEIVNTFGGRVDKLIGYLTNDVSDYDREAYHQKIYHAPETAKLIKLADLIENTTSVADNMVDLGLQWTEEFFLPIVSEMKEVIDTSTFSEFPMTAEYMKRQLADSYARLLQGVEKQKK